MDTLAEPILERDKERGRRRSLALRQGRVTQSQPKIGQPNIDNDWGKPAFRPSAALLLLGVPQRVRLRRRALHTAKIRASNVPIIC
jgi:hypothetical protein